MNKDSIIKMFGESAGCVENDMNRIVGRTEDAEIPVTLPAPSNTLAPLSTWEYNVMQTLLAVEGRPGFTAEQKALLQSYVKRYMANGGGDPYNAPLPPDPPVGPVDPNAPGPNNGNMMDLSNPLNTIVKSVFLISICSMFSPTVALCTAAGCTGVIIYSTIKLFNK